MGDQRSILLAEIVTDTVAGQNDDLFPAALQLLRDDGFVRITIAVQSAVKVRLVPDSGSGFYLNGGTALVADSVHVEDVPVDIGRTWNVQTDDALGMTVSIARAQSLAGIS